MQNPTSTNPVERRGTDEDALAAQYMHLANHNAAYGWDTDDSDASSVEIPDDEPSRPSSTWTDFARDAEAYIQERQQQHVKADQRRVRERERVGIDRARLRIHARDRERVDLVAQVGARGLAARQDRVAEGLERRVGQAGRCGRGQRGQRQLASERHHGGQLQERAARQHPATVPHSRACCAGSAG